MHTQGLWCPDPGLVLALAPLCQLMQGHQVQVAASAPWSRAVPPGESCQSWKEAPSGLGSVFERSPSPRLPSGVFRGGGRGVPQGPSEPAFGTGQNLASLPAEPTVGPFHRWAHPPGRRSERKARGVWPSRGKGHLLPASCLRGYRVVTKFSFLLLLMRLSTINIYLLAIGIFLL